MQVLCSVLDVAAAVQEVRRALRSGGVFIFMEHVAASPDSGRRRVQEWLNPLQRTVCDGCNCNR